jgi:hypothetical protein
VSDEVLGTALASFTFITVVWTIVGAYKARLKFHQRKLELAAQQASATTTRAGEDLAARHAVLEQRLRVLERIVTDRGDAPAIALQIEALRDATPLPEPLTQRLEVHAR